MDGKKVALKVTGIVVGIIAVCILLGIFVGAPIFKSMKYNNAQKLAESGQFAAAVAELQGNMDSYKDATLKKQEYALEAARQFYDDKNMDAALAYLDLALNGPDETVVKEAQILSEKINAE